MTETPANSPVTFAVVLAAGESRRFGSSKQLANINGEPLVQRAAALARDCCGENSIIVVGHCGAEVAAAADNLCQFLLVNDRYADGIGTSIALAARVLSGVADAMLLLLADQPLIKARHINKLLTTWSGADHEIVASKFDATLGPPVLMPRRAIARLTTFGGDRGAKQLLNDDAFDVRPVTCSAAAIDIDTPSDFERVSRSR